MKNTASAIPGSLWGGEVTHPIVMESTEWVASLESVWFVLIINTLSIAARGGTLRLYPSRERKLCVHNNSFTTGATGHHLDAPAVSQLSRLQ